MYRKIVAVFAASMVAPFLAVKAHAEDKPLTMAQCLQIANGLNSFDYVGEPLADMAGQRQKPPPDAKQYHLGALRGIIGLDMAALAVATDGFERSKRSLVLEIGGGKNIEPGSAQMSKFVDELQKVLEGPCRVSVGHLKLSDFNLGDGPDQNPVPPSVISVLAPIIDKD